MTFIPEDEARRRLKSPNNILSRRPETDQKPPEIDLNELFLPIDIDALISEVKAPQEKRNEQESNNTDQASTENPLPPRDESVLPYQPTPLDKQDQYFDPFTPLKRARMIDSGLDLRGRKTNIRNRTTEENAAVGLTSMLLGGTASEQMFGVPQFQQSLIKRGLTSSRDTEQGRAPKDELLDSIYQNGQKASDRAFQKLFKALDLLSDEKLGNVTKAKDLSQIAVNMSRIVQSVTPKDTGPEQGGVHFHIYGPEENRIEDYETVEVRPDGSVIFEPGGTAKSSTSVE